MTVNASFQKVNRHNAGCPMNSPSYSNADTNRVNLLRHLDEGSNNTLNLRIPKRIKASRKKPCP
ncbi:hypothetical protein RB2480 [Rhodopirellula baltica SH 1]|uniref:Uncharacterized protein n=1 Tax=Rhodopirellula baltica (strain DSM 10527 / NCIMB 13988 / SH1) TaxID=243090 RepID=Q7UVR6_RHOBA|nr:hypothetical protein RB2480 [Rhodopirellula baltica SH 1]